MVGQTISHYRVLSKLGEGGMGFIYNSGVSRMPTGILFLLRNQS